MYVHKTESTTNLISTAPRRPSSATHARPTRPQSPRASIAALEQQRQNSVNLQRSESTDRKRPQGTPQQQPSQGLQLNAQQVLKFKHFQFQPSQPATVATRPVSAHRNTKYLSGNTWEDQANKHGYNTGALQSPHPPQTAGDNRRPISPFLPPRPAPPSQLNNQTVSQQQPMRFVTTVTPVPPNASTVVVSQMNNERGSFGDQKPTLVFIRKPEEKKASPERINLDRRRLETCPIFEGEERLKLLNFQNNLIQEINNLFNLPNLIFLDFYNNRIKRICNLEYLPSLRVLMLGKNEIEKIEHLDSLHKLDVLDLHSNNITRIENLNALSELRVLNLSGNKIKVVENVASLGALTEINLRRNKISHAYELESLQHLQRVFLSSNVIRSFNDISSVFGIPSLMELSLDGNPVTADALYRHYVMDKLKNLRRLDMKRITDEERALAANREPLNIKKHPDMQARTEVQMLLQEEWSRVKPAADSSSDSDDDDDADIDEVDDDEIDEYDEEDDEAEETEEEEQDESTAQTQKQANTTLRTTGDIKIVHVSTPPSTKVVHAVTPPAKAYDTIPQNDDHPKPSKPTTSGKPATPPTETAPSTPATLLTPQTTAQQKKAYIELKGDTLIIVGNADLNSDKYPNVTTVCCRGQVFEQLTSMQLPKLRRLPNLRVLKLIDNNITSMDRISKLCSLSVLRELYIDDNPVCEVGNMLRLYCAAMLPNLEIMNGRNISSEERAIAESIYGRVREPSSTTAALLKRDMTQQQTAAQQTSQGNDSDSILHHAAVINAKLDALDAEWDSAVLDIIEQSLLKLQDIDGLMRSVLLSSEK